jgi:histidyl-tRNA synthetase
MAEKPSIPKGTRDFSPEVMVKRNYIFNTIRAVYQLFGYLPIETPAMENLSTLTGKYGEEGDQLIFKILNSGDFISKSDLSDTTKAPFDSKKIAFQISEKALRYDLTVPFARFVVQNRNEITFPFKRYQIQPVWRADRPQKGRYREFYQCDADVVGSDSLLNEVELVQIIDEVFKKLGLSVLIKINNRKILSGIAEVIGEADKIVDITVAIDKLDKIGLENVNKELIEKGVSTLAIEKLQPLLSISGGYEQKLEVLKNILSSSATGLKGIEELEYVFRKIKTPSLEIKSEIEFDITLARGLNYYTGAIFEVKANDTRSDFKGSICGGGRYDDLTGIFGMPGISGVGISFGADRIYDVMSDINLFPDFNGESTRILFVNFGDKEEEYCLGIIRKIRGNGINAEIFPEQAKMKKQMSYADSKKIPFVALVGSEEINSGKITVKNMQTGEQQQLPIDELIKFIQQ